MRVTLAFRRIAAAVCIAAGSALPAAAQEVKVRIAYVPVIGAASVFVAANAGWGKQAGLDISLVRFDSGPPAISAVASGTLDALAIGISPIAVARAKGLNVRVVAAAATGGSGFVASPALAQNFDAAPRSVAQAFAEFHRRTGRAARLATVPPGGVPYVALNYWLFKLNNVQRGDVQIVTLGIDAIQQAMLSGSVDGATVLEPALTLVRDRNPALKLIVTSNQMFDGIPGVAVAVTGAFAGAHPEAVDKLVGLVERGRRLIRERPLEAAGYLSSVLGGGLVEPEPLARALASPAVRFVTDPAAIEEPSRRLFAYQAELGDFDNPPSIEGLFDKAPWLRLSAAR